MIALIFAACSSAQVQSPLELVEGPEMCCGHEETLTRDVFVYADTDADGIHDEGEAPIPNALIIATGNVHGGPKRSAWTTDQDGRATVSLSVTHILNVDAIAPCGYEASSENSVNAFYDDAPLSFGFIPRDPQSGDAVIRFHLWNDLNADGIHDPDDPPLPGIVFSITPAAPTAFSFGEHEWMAGEGNAGDAHMLQTDDQGWAEITLANSCGVLRVWPPGILSPDVYNPAPIFTTFTDPPATPESDETESGGYLGGERLVFSYSLGETVIEWGLSQPD